jgi:hypothetical protein
MRPALAKLDDAGSFEGCFGKLSQPVRGNVGLLVALAISDPCEMELTAGRFPSYSPSLQFLEPIESSPDRSGRFE